MFVRPIKTSIWLRGIEKVVIIFHLTPILIGGLILPKSSLDKTTESSSSIRLILDLNQVPYTDQLAGANQDVYSARAANHLPTLGPPQDPVGASTQKEHGTTDQSVEHQTNHETSQEEQLMMTPTSTEVFQLPSTHLLNRKRKTFDLNTHPPDFDTLDSTLVGELTPPSGSLDASTSAANWPLITGISPPGTDQAAFDNAVDILSHHPGPSSAPAYVLAQQQTLHTRLVGSGSNKISKTEDLRILRFAQLDFNRIIPSPTISQISHKMACSMFNALLYTPVMAQVRDDLVRILTYFNYNLLLKQIDTFQWQNVQKVYSMILQSLIRKAPKTAEEVDTEILRRSIIWISETIMNAVDPILFRLFTREYIPVNKSKIPWIAQSDNQRNESGCTKFIRFLAHSQSYKYGRYAHTKSDVSRWLLEALKQDLKAGYGLDNQNGELRGSIEGQNWDSWVNKGSMIIKTGNSIAGINQRDDNTESYIALAYFFNQLIKFEEPLFLEYMEPTRREDFLNLNLINCSPKTLNYYRAYLFSKDKIIDHDHSSIDSVFIATQPIWLDAFTLYFPRQPESSLSSSSSCDHVIWSIKIQEFYQFYHTHTASVMTESNRRSPLGLR